MIRLALATALALAALAGSAGAEPLAFKRASVLPSAETPNAPGSIALPTAFKGPPAVLQTRSFPELEELWRRAGEAYGIPWPVLASINKIESNFGRNMGPSSAGAVGWMQFMPSTWLRWGMDGDADGLADPWDPEDAVFSAARYLAAAGGRTDLPRAVFAYNHAQWYVEEVLEVARVFEAGGDVALGVDRLQQTLAEARRDVAATSEALTAATREERRLAAIERRLAARVNGQKLLTDRLAAQQRAVQAGVRHDAAATRVAELKARLADAEGQLASALAGARSASLAAGARTLLSAPAYDGQWVFPVGGGPGVVTVGHDHHDYPAADIAAPAGSPVYALADAIVRAAWHAPAGNCGIGATLETADGRKWTYCHLSYLEPSVAEGAFLGAGTPLGLVGSTGHSTGPHLHVQLQPPTAYPQDEPWFRGFAGVAFTWQQDAPDRPAARAAVRAATHPIFSVSPGAGEAVAFTR